MDFTNKVVVITGSARGIGRKIAERFASVGASVVVSDLDQAAVTTVADEIGGPTIGVKANVLVASEIDNLLSTAVTEFGRLDVVVNNAGITCDTLMIRMDEKDWDKVLDINLKGAFLVSKSAARIMMKQRSGRIINISSVIGLIGNAGQTNYAASKAGLIGLTKSAARELAGRGITVNAVAPGFIDTDMTREMPAAAKEEFLKTIAMRRLGSTDDIASATIFFASDDASYVTGQVLAVDGGMTMQ